MDDVREISAELQRIAGSEPMDDFDTAALLARGRRGRRRRKLLGLGGAVAGVAVVAVAASLLPNLATANKQPAVAAPQNSDFGPVPGVPRGEAAADQRITHEEAERRCNLRTPGVTQKLRGTGTARSGHAQMYDLKNGTRVTNGSYCIIPGGDKPSAELVAAAAKDLLPQSAADKLRNCSVIAWVDLTNWQVVASDQSKALGSAALVAISPSGRKVVDCELTSRKSPLGDPAGSTSFATLTNLDSNDPTLDPEVRSGRTDMYVAGGGGGECVAGTCHSWNMTGWGRVASKAATTVRLRIGTGPVYQVPVSRGGWFAFTWLTSSTYDLKKPNPRVAAYDANGKIVKVFQ
ncbi:hypothetical protein ACQHIV_34275 [Kribbella sp. GL6]|uniref:hypothetical protein n=1 Tax=Kribbella sp. GL6 TaxID=3419765 RepID=UPI003D00A8A1